MEMIRFEEARRMMPGSETFKGIDASLLEYALKKKIHAFFESHGSGIPVQWTIKKSAEGLEIGSAAKAALSPYTIYKIDQVCLRELKRLGGAPTPVIVDRASPADLGEGFEFIFHHPEKIHLQALKFDHHEIKNLVRKIREKNPRLKNSNLGRRISPLTIFIDQEIESGRKRWNFCWDRLLNESEIKLDEITVNTSIENKDEKEFLIVTADNGMTAKIQKISFRKQFNLTLKNKRSAESSRL